ncbi:hypothetical protein MMC25_004979 [Agyrium rufum]|nr:hypothetical protein [Agyrium rufum]
MADHKGKIRQQVWQELRKVALPDSRFHYDFAEFIADFRGSSSATQQLLDHTTFRDANLVFITPDNCLEELRLRSLKSGKRVLMTTYAIRRGFFLLDPAVISVEKFEYACTLDGMERYAQQIDLRTILAQDWKVDLMVTGTGAINQEGIRFGKGHGFFDLEWGMLYMLKKITTLTPTAAIVHDCQVLAEKLTREEFDTTCELISTPTRLINVADAQKPTCGILWDKLAQGMLESIPPLLELREMVEDGVC